MDRFRKSYHIGVAYGMLNGISMRPDVPKDVRESCKEVVNSYRKESDAWDSEGEK